MAVPAHKTEYFIIENSNLQKKGGCGKSCVNSIKTSLLGENYGRNNFYQGGFST